ncbi:MAG TPA: NAD-dependent epimerase/dehydratase family protein [Longimicrobiales bacterium]
MEASTSESEQRPLRVFVTGATGYVGSAIVREFVRAGHEVTGLTRWAEHADDLEALGARAVVGDMRDPLSFRAVAAQYEVLIHAAAEPSAARARLDAAAVETLLAAARRRALARAKGEPPPMLIYTSGVWSLGNTGAEPADESRPPDPAFELVAWRAECERKVLAAAGPDLATAVVRPGMVYGGRGGLLAGFFASAERDGAAAYAGEGKNRWSLVYREDNARLYRCIAERRATGIFHAVDGTPLPVEELARLVSEAAGRGGATRSIPLAEARALMGEAVDALVLDQAVVTRRAAELGWTPRFASFREGVPTAYREWAEGRAG